MIFGRFSARTVAIGSVGGLVAVLIGGGAAMWAAERSSYLAGVWMTFNVITTVGFGSGPETVLGQLVAMGSFVAAGMCWFGVLLVAIETAHARFQKGALTEEALRPLERYRGGRLFTKN